MSAIPTHVDVPVAPFGRAAVYIVFEGANAGAARAATGGMGMSLNHTIAPGAVSPAWVKR